jgi:hypothetical protein
MKQNRDYKELCKRISAKVNLLVGQKLTTKEFRLKLKEVNCPYYVPIASFISKKYAVYGQKYSFDTPIYYMDFYDDIKHFIEVKKYGIDEVKKTQPKMDFLEKQLISDFEKLEYITNEALLNELRKRGYSGSIFIKKEIKL